METIFALEKLAGQNGNKAKLLDALVEFYRAKEKDAHQQLAVARTVVAMKSLTFAAGDAEADLGYLCLMHEATFCLKRPNARLEVLRTAFNKLCEDVHPFKADPDAENWEVVRIASDVWKEYGEKLDALVEVEVSGPEQWWDMLEKKVFVKPSKPSGSSGSSGATPAAGPVQPAGPPPAPSPPKASLPAKEPTPVMATAQSSTPAVPATSQQPEQDAEPSVPAATPRNRAKVKPTKRTANAAKNDAASAAPKAPRARTRASLRNPVSTAEVEDSDAEPDDVQKPQEKQPTKSKGKEKAVETADEDEVPVRKAKAAKGKGKEKEKEVEQEKEEAPQAKKGKGKPKAQGKGDKGDSAWRLGGCQSHIDRPGYQALELRKPVDLYTLVQQPEFHGINSLDLAVFVKPCKHCWDGKHLCIYRPTWKSGKWVASSCLCCYRRNSKCSANDGQSVAIGKELKFMHADNEDLTSGGKKPQLRKPDTEIRAALVNKLVSEGLMATPTWIAADKRLIPEKFAKLETDEESSLYYKKVAKYFPHKEEYYEAFPEYNDANPKAFEPKKTGKSKEDAIDADASDESDAPQPSQSVRRSARNKSVKTQDDMDVDEDDASEGDDEDEEDEVEVVATKTPKKKVVVELTRKSAGRAVTGRAGSDFGSDLKYILDNQAAMREDLVRHTRRLDDQQRRMNRHTSLLKKNNELIRTMLARMGLMQTTFDIYVGEVNGREALALGKLREDALNHEPEHEDDDEGAMGDTDLDADADSEQDEEMDVEEEQDKGKKPAQDKGKKPKGVGMLGKLGLPGPSGQVRTASTYVKRGPFPNRDPEWPHHPIVQDNDGETDGAEGEDQGLSTELAELAAEAAEADVAGSAGLAAPTTSTTQDDLDSQEVDQLAASSELSREQTVPLGGPAPRSPSAATPRASPSGTLPTPAMPPTATPAPATAAEVPTDPPAPTPSPATETRTEMDAIATPAAGGALATPAEQPAAAPELAKNSGPHEMDVDATSSVGGGPMPPPEQPAAAPEPTESSALGQAPAEQESVPGTTGAAGEEEPAAGAAGSQGPEARPSTPQPTPPAVEVQRPTPRPSTPVQSPERVTAAAGSSPLPDLAEDYDDDELEAGVRPLPAAGKKSSTQADSATVKDAGGPLKNADEDKEEEEEDDGAANEPASPTKKARRKVPVQPTDRQTRRGPPSEPAPVVEATKKRKRDGDAEEDEAAPAPTGPKKRKGGRK